MENIIAQQLVKMQGEILSYINRFVTVQYEDPKSPELCNRQKIKKLRRTGWRRSGKDAEIGSSFPQAYAHA